MAVNDYHCHQETFLSEFAAIVDQHEPTPEGNLILIHLIYIPFEEEWMAPARITIWLLLLDRYMWIQSEFFIINREDNGNQRVQLQTWFRRKEYDGVKLNDS